MTRYDLSFCPPGRCSSLHVNPWQKSVPNKLEETELAKLKREHREFLRSCMPILYELYVSIQNAPFVITITGRDIDANDFTMGMIIATAEVIESRIRLERVRRENRNGQLYRNTLMNLVARGALVIGTKGEIYDINNEARPRWDSGKG